MADAPRFTVEVAYAAADRQRVVTLEVDAGRTVRDAIEQSGLLGDFPEIDLATQAVGVFGRVCALNRPLGPGDRVEIYRPLHADPKEARRARARDTRPRGSGGGPPSV